MPGSLICLSYALNTNRETSKKTVQELPQTSFHNCYSLVLHEARRRIF